MLLTCYQLLFWLCTFSSWISRGHSGTFEANSFHISQFHSEQVSFWTGLILKLDSTSIHRLEWQSLKRCENTWERESFVIDALIFNQIWTNLKKLQKAAKKLQKAAKSCKKHTFFHFFFPNFFSTLVKYITPPIHVDTGMNIIWVKTASVERKNRSALRKK